MPDTSNKSKSLLDRYWESLGGWEVLFRDKWFYMSVGLTVVTLPLWLQPLWWDATITTMSIMIGFSVSGFSVVLALSTKRFSDRLLRRSSYNSKSPFLMFNAAFVLYMMSGFIALLFSFFCKAWYQPQWFTGWDHDIHDLQMWLTVLSKFLWLIGGWLFCYSLCSGMSAILYIYRIAEMIQKVADHEASRALKAKAATVGSTNAP